MKTDLHKTVSSSFRVQTSVCKFRRASRSEEHAQAWTLNKAKHTVTFVKSLIFILICTSFTSLSQIPPEPPPSAQNFHQWGAVTLFNGLPSDNVRAITQTPDGILWFGTDGGLARFDGRRVQIFALSGLSSNKILTLETFVTGEIWIGTDAGAGRFYDGAFTPIPETVGKPITSILSGEITTLVSSDTIFSAHHNPDNSLQIIASEPNNLQFAAAERINDVGLIFGSNGRGLIIEKDEFQEVLSRPRPFFVNALKADANGDLWIGAKSEKGASGLFYAKDVFRPERVG